MKALVLNPQLEFRNDWPLPELKYGEALIRPLMVGICNTDLELVRGYMGFRGVLGHEFVGIVEECDETEWVGRRVVGEINCAPPADDVPDPRHLTGRTVLGILGRDGVMAERFCLPIKNLLMVPDDLSDQRAVFTEPLAAAYEIQEQLGTLPDSAVVLGDGKLGTLCALALQAQGCRVTLVGKHRKKLDAVADIVRTATLEESETLGLEAQCPLVVEATGSPSGLAKALTWVRPRGTVILKTTVAAPHTLDLAPIVINEIQILGSRCGRFAPALEALAQGLVCPDFMIQEIFELEDALTAFERAAQPGSRKILLRFS